MRAIEQNRALGSEQKIEEVLESVAKQVQQRQKHRDTQQDKGAQGNSKTESSEIDLGGRNLTRSFTMATRATPTTVGSGADPKKGTGIHAYTVLERKPYQNIIGKFSAYMLNVHIRVYTYTYTCTCILALEILLVIQHYSTQ